MVDKIPKFDDREIKEQSKKISSISNSVKKLQEGELRKVSNTKDVNRLISTTAKVVQKLGGAADAMVTGIKNTTVGAAKYSKEAIKQYGQALQEDIQLDVGKLRVLSAAGGPVVGYFINKLLETPAFKNAIGKIAETMSVAGTKFKNLITSGAKSIGSVFGRIGSVFGRLFRRGKKPEELVRGSTKREKTKRGVFVEKDGEILYYPTGGRKKVKTEIPRLQEGGVIGRGGLARLHPAEIVMPIEELLKYQEKSRKLTQISFTKSFKKIRDEGYVEYEQPFHKRFLDGLFELKAAIVKDPINLTYRLRNMWLGFLDKHPVFRTLNRIGGFFLKLPFRILFSRFGGKYRRLVSQNNNPLVATAQTIGAFYPLMTWKMDQQIQLLEYNLEANRDTAAALTGKRYGPVHLIKFGRTSLVKILSGYMTKIKTVIGKLTVRGAKAITRKVLGRPREEIKEFREESPMEVLIKIQSKALYRLDLMLRKQIGIGMYRLLMSRESEQIEKLVDIQKNDSRQRLTIMERFKGFMKKHFMKVVRDVGLVLKRAAKFSWNLIKPFINAKTLMIIGGIIILRKILNKYAEQISRNLKLVFDYFKQFNIKDVLKDAFKFYGDKINKFIKWGKGTDKRIKEWALGIQTRFRKWLKELPGRIWDYFKNLTLSKSVDNISKSVSSVATGVKEMPDKIVRGVQTIGDKLLAVVKILLWPIEKVLGLVTKILFPGKFREAMGKEFSERGEIERRTSVTRGIAESKLMRAYRRRLERGKISQTAFDRITEGGPTGMTDRIIQLRRDKEIIQIGDMIMTSRERFGTIGAKALFKEKVTRQITEKVGEAKKVAGGFISKVGRGTVRTIKAIPEVAISAAETVKIKSEMAKQQIQEKVITPVLSTSEMARMKAGEKVSEIKAGLKSSKEVQEGLDKMKEFQGVIVNNFNRATNMINSSVSSMANGQQDKGIEFDLDPNVFDIIRGDLE